jgi:hypothetical protein
MRYEQLGRKPFMKSPFPGMDPYIEACGLWEDFHSKLIGDMERTLSISLPERYNVMLAERSYVVLGGPEGKDESTFLPDVGVVSRPQRTERTPKAIGGAVAEPVTEGEAVPLRAFIATEYRELFIEIYDQAEERRLVTAIELLSPSNKRRGTPGWDLYQRKRQGLLLGEANFIEIDLVREGGRLPMLDPWPDSPYAILVCRRERAPNCRAWPGYFHRPLPEIPVPLLHPDPDFKLALQTLVEAVCTRTRYPQLLNYSKQLTLPLNEEEADWVKRQVASAARTAEKPSRRRGGSRRRQ